MPCYKPIPASYDGNTVKMWRPIGENNLALPCGKCIGCRTARATMWADRCQHEAKKYPNNTFITLTYADEHLPKDGHLEPEALQRFFKRLRRQAEYSRTIVTHYHRSIKYFAAGEYGERNDRPHYHAILFNADFNDKVKIGRAKNGDTLYYSDSLRNLWPYGQNTLGNATPAAASYIAQYSLKKIGTGDADADGVWRPPPFLRASQGLGQQWRQLYENDLRKGYFVRDGKPRKIPREYLTKIKEEKPELYEEIQYNLTKHVRGDATAAARLRDAEIIHHRRKQLSEDRNL